MLCRHCNETPGTRARGLCWRCYYAPGVRGRYASKIDRGAGLRKGRLPCVPTSAMPGSSEKIRILADRAARGQELFHANDLCQASAVVFA